MKNLWAPWRISYIQGKAGKTDGCIFDIEEEQTFDRNKLALLRDRLSVVLLNRFPYANGHLLVAPARHLADLEELENEEAEHLMEMIRKSTAILKNQFNPDGFNIGLNLGEVDGAGLADHLHFHIIPRWRGDHNFMATVAAIRTIPEHIARTFDRLLPDFQALAKKHPKSSPQI
jgi:ATP adenylyltransferase